ncbi:MAG: serine--tRNA ligase, partial [Oscillospiraceae bacterium]|nr:serine--tRNA ligase [Oscillospiraceae bacterium]
MLDIKFLRENPDAVRENIRKKFQDQKLPLVDEVIELDRKNRAAIREASDLRARRNQLSKANGPLFGKLKKAEGEEKAAIQAQIDANMAEVTADDQRLSELEQEEAEYAAELHKRMLLIPNIIDPSVPIGPDDSCNVEVQRFGEPVVPAFEVPYHTEIMERLD